MYYLPVATGLAAELVRRQFEETDVPEPTPREPRFRALRLAVAAGLERAARAVAPTPRRLGSGVWQG
jgi:hypothetical protein